MALKMGVTNLKMGVTNLKMGVTNLKMGVTDLKIKGIFQGPSTMGPPKMVRIPKDIGMVWEASHKGGPIAGGP